MERLLSLANLGFSGVTKLLFFFRFATKFRNRFAKIFPVL
jgi:hypothetical protein